MERYFCRYMKLLRRTGLPFLLGLLLLSGCTINRDIMFKTDNQFVFDEFKDSTSLQIKLQPNDVFEFRLFANDGFKMIDLISDGAAREAQQLVRFAFNYTIEFDGLAKMPLLGRVALSGLTTREAELMLEEKYAKYYNKPYVQLVVVNRRVVVFPGGGGDARLVPLENNNTSLLEVLGLAGGLNKRGDARKVKVFRYDKTGKRLVYQFDLSTIDGLQYADMVMQGDDVVYVQPNPDIAREALQDITPIVGLLTSIALIIGIFRGFN